MTVWELILRVGFVALVLAGSMWGLRRWGTRATRPGADLGGLRVVARQTLGKHSSLLLVEAGGRRVLVGVGTGVHMVDVGSADTPAPLAPDNAPAPTETAPAHSASTADEPPVRPAVVSIQQAVARLGVWLGFTAPAPPAVAGEFAAVLAEADTRDSDEDAPAAPAATADALASEDAVSAAETTEAPAAPARRASAGRKAPAKRATARKRTTAKKPPAEAPAPTPSRGFVAQPAPVLSSTAAFNAGVRTPARRPTVGQS